MELFLLIKRKEKKFRQMRMQDKGGFQFEVEETT